MSYKAVIIGGSAGSFQIITALLSALPKNYPVPVILCLHRLKHIRKGFDDALSIKSNMPIIEPTDKEHLKPGFIYLAPANYHMYIELGGFIALSTEPPVNHSRPSIDLSFASAAYSYKNKLLGILLSGANKDGAFGLKRIKDEGGTVIVQDPKDAQVATMPETALDMLSPDYVLSSKQIIEFLLKLK